MSRFSYSLDIGEELEREKEVKRKIAAKGGDDEDNVRLDPKFEQEIQQLAEEPTVTYDKDDSIVITPAAVNVQNKPVKIEPAKSAKVEAPKEARPAKAEAKPVKSAQKVDEPKKVVKPIVKPVAKPAPKPVKKVEEKKVDAKKDEAAKKETVVAVAPTPNPVPLATEPRTPSDGNGRLVLALLLVSVIAIALIYSGLASTQAAPVAACYQQYVDTNNLNIIQLSNLSEARAFWFKRAMLADNEAEAVAIMKMVVCDKEPTKESNPLDYTRCDYLGRTIMVRDSELQSIIGLSNQSKCDSLGDVISCDNHYLIDGFIASKDGRSPAHMVAKAGGVYRITDFANPLPETVAVVSDTKDVYVSYTLPVEQTKSIGMKLLVGDEFGSFKRVYLDHTAGNERVVLYKFV